MADSSSRLATPEQSRSVTATWPVEHETLFIDIMISHVKKGGMVTSTFSKHTWKEIYDEFSQSTGRSYSAMQFKNKYNKLRQRFKNFKALITGSGLGWDQTLYTVLATDAEWEEYLKVNPDCKPFRSKGCPEYPKLCTIFGETTATGRYAWSTAQEAIPEEPHVEPEESSTQNNEIGAGESTSTRHRKTSRADSIAEAIRELAGASREKYKMEATSSRSSLYSISTCMEELKKYADIVPPLKRLKASKELQDRKWRETFICMDEETRLVWFDSL